MELSKFEALRNIKAIITINDLADSTTRTLIYGYTLDRMTFHLYLKDNMFHYVIYDNVNNILIKSEVNLLEINPYTLPSKRAYPARCDYEYCYRIMSMGVEIPFTTYEDTIVKQLYGLTYEEIIDAEFNIN